MAPDKRRPREPQMPALTALELPWLLQFIFDRTLV